MPTPDSQNPNPTPPRRSARRWKRRLLAVAFGCIVGLVVLKAADLVTGRSRATQTRHWLRLTPNASVRHRSTDFDYTFTTNRLGFRGADVAFEKPPGTRRIVVLGDSFTAGYGVADDDVFTVRLQQQLNGREDVGRTEVVNLGRVGSSTIRERDIYDEFAARFAPDVVILAFFLGNDLAEIVEEHDRTELENWTPPGRVRGMAYTCFPNLYLELAMWKQTSREHHRLSPRDPDALIADLQQAAMQLGRPASQGEERFRGLPPVVQRAACEGTFPYMHLVHACFDHQRLRRSLDPDNAFFNVAWPRVARNLEALHDRVSSDGARFLIVLFPAAVQIAADSLEFNRSLGFEVDPAWLTGRCRTQAALHAWAETADVPLFDLTDDLRAGKQPVYHAWDPHFNAAGHTLVADTIAAWPELHETHHARDAPGS